MSRSRRYFGRRHPYDRDAAQRATRRDKDVRDEIFEGLLEFFDHAIILRPKRVGLPWKSRWDYRSGRAAQWITQSAYDAPPRRRKKRVWRYLDGGGQRFIRIVKAFTVSGRWAGYWMKTAAGFWYYRQIKRDLTRPYASENLATRTAQ